MKQARKRGEMPPALQRALEAAIDTKALAPTILNVTEIAGYTDWALLLSGRSARHVEGVTQAIVDALRAMGRRPIGTDGLEDHLWDLLDYDDFIIHVFYHPVRVHYDLESMWSDAPRVQLDLPAEVMDVSGLADLPPPDRMPGYRGQEFGGFDDELAAVDEEDFQDLDGGGDEAYDAADDDAFAADDEDDEDDDFGEDDDFDDMGEDDFDDDDFADDEAGDEAGDDVADEALAEPPRAAAAPPAKPRRGR